MYSLIADVRTIGSESGCIKQSRENGWWTDDFGRMLVTDRVGERLGCLNYYRASHSCPGLEIGTRIFRPGERGKGIMSEAVGLFVGCLFSAKQIERI